MSSEGQPFNDSGVENVGDTNPVTNNKEPQPIEMERMDKPKHDVGQTAASNNESKERSEKQEDDNGSKSASPDKEKERHTVKSQEECDVTKDECFTEQSTDLTNVRLTTKIEQLEHKNRELEQSLYETRQALAEETEKNKQELEIVIAHKITALLKAGAAEEAITKHKRDIEHMTRTNSNLNERIHQMEEAVRVSDRENNSLTKSINKLKQEVGKRDKTITQEKENTKQLNKDLKETKARKMELQRIEAQFKEHLNSLQTSNSKLLQSNDTYAKQLKNLEALTSKLKQDLARTNADYNAAYRKINELEEHIRSLTLRLSKIAGANLAYQNPNIADLGDPNRQTKLAEKFSELYDNQWTDAFEDIDSQDDQEKIKRLYDILKKLDGHCLDVCWNYDADVKKSLTNLTVTSKIKVLKPEQTQEVENDTGSPSQNGFKIPLEKVPTLLLQAESKEEMTGNVGLCNTYLWHNKKTETGQIGAEKKMEGELADENNEYNPDVKSVNESNEAAPDVTQDTQRLEYDTDCKKGTSSAEKERSHVELVNQNDQSAEFHPDFNVTTEGNECTDDVSQHDVEPQNENQTKQAEHKKNVIDLKFDFDTLTNSHKQTISEIRRIVHTQLEDQVVKAIAQAVLEEMELPRETGIVSYVEECTKICWLARLHDLPVYIEFEEIDNDSPFNGEMYKAYTKTGKRLDYVVWPPVFLHKNGPLLSKGVAQGK